MSTCSAGLHEYMQRCYVMDLYSNNFFLHILDFPLVVFKLKHILYFSPCVFKYGCGVPTYPPSVRSHTESTETDLLCATTSPSGDELHSFIDFHHHPLSIFPFRSSAKSPQGTIGHTQPAVKWQASRNIDTFSFCYCTLGCKHEWHVFLA